MADFDPQAWLELGRANLDKLPEGVVLPEPQIDYERYRAVLQRFYDVSQNGVQPAPNGFDSIDRSQIRGVLAVADEIIALRDGPKNDGWLEWRGGECPVPARTEVEVRFRNGETRRSCRPTDRNWGYIGRPSSDWDIVAYRIVEEN